MNKKILTIDYDQDIYCPQDEDDGCWKLYSFGRRMHHYKNPDHFMPVTIGLRRKLNVGLAFWLQYYEHGLGRYDISGTGPQCQWDTVSLAGILIWEHRPGDMGAKTYSDRQKDACAYLETYNNWMNGQVFYYLLQDEEGNMIDSCGGFYDKNSLIESVQASLEVGDQLDIQGQAAGYLSPEDFNRRLPCS